MSRIALGAMALAVTTVPARAHDALLPHSHPHGVATEFVVAAVLAGLAVALAMAVVLARRAGSARRQRAKVRSKT